MHVLARLGPLAARLRERRVGFAADERGVVAVIFAITFCAVFLTVAVAIDYARTATEYLRVQNAVDSAALAASHRLGLPDQDTQGPADANAYFKANTASTDMSACSTAWCSTAKRARCKQRRTATC